MNYKHTSLNQLIRAKDTLDTLKGYVEAEIDFDSVCMQFRAEPEKLQVYMQAKYLQDGESELMKRLVKTNDAREEAKIKGQIKRMRQLHKLYEKSA